MEKTPDIHAILSITSTGNRLDAEDHELNLQVITSNPISISAVAEGLTNDQKHYILTRLGYNVLQSFEDLPVSATFMLEKINDLTVNESVEILQQYLIEHDGDVNIPTAEYDFVEDLINGQSNSVKTKLSEATEKQEAVETSKNLDSGSSLEGNQLDGIDWELKVKTEAGLIAYWSPYPEVRSVSEPFDDPSTPTETIRVYIVGLVWTCIGSFINQYFSERLPSITLDTSVVQLFIYPSGILLEKILPAWKFNLWNLTIDLNPGPWNYKEQMLTTLFYSVSGGTPYVSSNIHAQKISFWYNNKWANFGYQLLLMLSTNFLGFGLAGIMRKFAVYPIKSIWPSILPTLALNKALMQPEKRERINGWSISRYYFFFATTAASFLYFWFPDYIFQALSTFNWLSWIAPNNLSLATITGSVSGLGINPITSFDWNIINSNYALTIPFYSQLNQYIGSVLAIFPILAVWYSNYKWTGFMPINSNALFTNTGEAYSVAEVLNENSLLDIEKYKAYGPPFYTAANLVMYGAFFAIYPFSIVYVFATHWNQISFAIKGLWGLVRNFKKSTYEGYNDPYTRSMTKYKEVPEWAFTCVLVISIVLAILCIKLYPTETPVWGIFFAIGINFAFLIPLTLIYSITGFSFGLNVLVELIVGYALPGNGLALMFIKALGYNVDGQAQNYITDQKMGHYLRIAPRALFRVQMLSVLVSSLVSLGTLNLALNTIVDYCVRTQPQKFSCPGSRTFFSASVLWGVIGPKRVFGGLYPVLQWCFLIGFLLAFPCIAIKKYFKQYKAVRYFQPVLIIGGFLIYAPYNLSYYTPGLIASYFFMYLIRKRYFNWWSKYNYVLSGGLQAGVAFSAVIIFFAVQYHEKDINWWGNSVMYNGLDGAGPARLDASTSAPDGYFGPRVGHFP